MLCAIANLQPDTHVLHKQRVYYDKEQREYVNWLRSLHAFLQK